jgi:cytochrome c-type protein NapC
MVTPKPKPGLFSRKILLGTTLGAALFFMIVGVIFWGSFNTAMEATNTLDFCISCHEMKDNVYQEYKKTIHYTNRSGVRATCSDCHVPDPWVHKVVRKIQASKEVLHKVLGTIDTPEKFDQHRLQMARNVWNAMKTTDSRECRNCHNFNSMKGKKGSKKKVKEEEEEPAAETATEPEPEVAAPVAAAEPAPVASTPAAAPAPASGGSDIDWSSVEPVEINLFYPGEASMEWILKGSDHSGKRSFTKGDRCVECHEEEEVDIGELIMSGDKLEPDPIRTQNM